VDDRHGSQGNDLEETAREHNSRLQRLIETIGSVITASRALLLRLPGAAPDRMEKEDRKGKEEGPAATRDPGPDE
jgi:hypothetical protein